MNIDHQHKAGDRQHEAGDHDGHSHDEAPKNTALNPNAKGSLEMTLRVTGMDCADKVEALEQVLNLAIWRLNA